MHRNCKLENEISSFCCCCCCCCWRPAFKSGLLKNSQLPRGTCRGGPCRTPACEALRRIPVVPPRSHTPLAPRSRGLGIRFSAGSGLSLAPSDSCRIGNAVVLFRGRSQSTPASHYGPGPVGHRHEPSTPNSASGGSHTAHSKVPSAHGGMHMLPATRPLPANPPVTRRLPYALRAGSLHDVRLVTRLYLLPAKRYMQKGICDVSTIQFLVS